MQPPECALQASGSVQSYRPSNRNNDTACRSGSNLPENTGLTPPSPHDLELDNQDALKQLTEQYKQVGPASQVKSSLPCCVESVYANLYANEIPVHGVLCSVAALSHR